FEIAAELQAEIKELLEARKPPKEAICTRHYDGSLKVEFIPAISAPPVAPRPAIDALRTFAGAGRRLEAPAPDQEEATQEMRTALAAWATDWEQKLNPHADLRGEEGAKILSALR